LEATDALIRIPHSQQAQDVLRSLLLLASQDVTVLHILYGNFQYDILPNDNDIKLLLDSKSPSRRIIAIRFLESAISRLHLPLIQKSLLDNDSGVSDAATHFLKALQENGALQNPNPKASNDAHANKF
jgi:hypothetical protein